ncbi:molecular chaperone HscC [Sphingomonas sp. ABOLD]|uniref:Molecular chaperone HscC n=1 Tax=Sphingomonas trueperi TaxID=53317 RepID=A0A7X6BCZ0_9SPHN|nr:molecular chaperone HscC [Sphingomonas sp. ABOLD]NJB97755.1 molecular chaperone HscC [Sphingomonas trueperi]RSV52944.1 molecular chaperone HscC [Sphingomonas sp. ABOLD]
MIVGIDLGTTNSAIARWGEGGPELIPNSLGDVLTPSAVSLTEDGAVLVGRAARDRQPVYPDRTATAFKRLIGTQKPIQLGGTAFTAEEVSALVLKSLKADAERHCGEEVTSAVITVPAYFSDRQRKATRRAGELAGLKVERLVNEPTAAALAYGIADREDRDPFLVFDLGGGTFDVSIVEIFDGVIEVRASAGDNRLGGEDFNEVIVGIAKERLRLPLGAAHPKLREQARAAAERTRRALSEAEAATFDIVWQDELLSTTITAEQFETAAAPLLDRLREPVLRAMRDSNLRAETLREIVLVGGATRMPVVRKAVTRMFARFPNASIHPDHAIALGAAVQAGLRERRADLDEIRLTDVCPFSLGIEVMTRDAHGRLHGGRFAPILERNTVLPASRVHRFQTVHAQQRKVQFEIYQGEARLVAANIKLGEVEIPVPPRAAGEVMIDCRFTYDVSGLLEVDVIVPETGETRQLVIADQEVDPGEAEARRAALAELKIHPRDQAASQALIARAERCYEAFIGDRRATAGDLLAHFEGVLETQDGHAIAEAAAMITRKLDAMEGERYL